MKEKKMAVDKKEYALNPGFVGSLTTETIPDKLVRRNLPPFLKPGEIGIGITVSGEIIAVVDSPSTTVKGKLLHLRHSSGTEFTFPCTGSIRNALAPGKKDDELEKSLQQEIGKTIYLTRMADKLSEKYKKNMFIFDVRTTA